jgi:O-antigen/teichoic acid export membrane protein
LSAIATPSLLLRQLATIGWSLIAARLISIGALLMFSAVTGPEPFAAFGVYLGLLAIAWIVVCGRYDQAIVFAVDDREARSLTWLCAAIGTGVVAATAVSIAAINVWHVPLPGGLDRSVAAAILPASLAARAALRVATQLATRAGDFGSISRSAWAHACSQALVLVASLTGNVDPLTGLAMADACGYSAAAGVLLASHGLRIADPSCTRPSLRARWVEIRPLLMGTATTWRQMPTWNLPASLVSVAATSLPMIALPIGLSANEAGQIALALRVLDMPLQLITGTATPVMQKHLQSSGYSRAVLDECIFWLAAAAVIAFAAIGVVAAIIAPWWTATRWSLAIDILPWLAPYAIGLALSGPLVDLVAGFRAERRGFRHHVAFLVMVIAACSLFVWPLNVRWGIALLGCAALSRAAAFAHLLRQPAANRTGPSLEGGVN